MRTTVTLEPDVADLISELMKERGMSFREAINSAVRAGLRQSGTRAGSFVQKSFSMGGEQSFRWDKALEAAMAIEDEELGRKISLRK